MPLDSICKKIISKNIEYFSDYWKKNYYFCSPDYKKKFDALEKSIREQRQYLFLINET
jgi:coenzyme F420 hydrogenase subunit beta